MDFGASKVNSYRAELERLRCGLRQRRRASQQCFNSRQKLRHLKRLCEVIVRTKLESYDFVHNLTPCGQHDYRSSDVVLPQLAADVKAVLFWQHHIQDQKVERLASGAAQTFFAVTRNFNGKAFAVQAII